MASITNKLARNFKLLSLVKANTQATTFRTIFSQSAIGIDRFKREQGKAEAGIRDTGKNSKDLLASAISDANAKVNTSDIRNILYATKTDEDVDLLIKSLIKYESGDKMGEEFSFAPELMRLFYVMDKPDKAIEVFRNEKLKRLFNSPSSLLILMNKLIEDKRYKDAISMFECYMEDDANRIDIVSHDQFKMVSEALILENTPEALEKLKKFLSMLKFRRPFNIASKTLNALLAINQKDYDLAREIILGTPYNNQPIIENLKVIINALSNKFDESFESMRKIIIMRSAPESKGVYVYPLTMKILRNAIEGTKDEGLMKKLEEVKTEVINSRILSNTDLIERFTRVMLEYTPPNKKNEAGKDEKGMYRNRNFGDRRFGDQGAQTLGDNSDRRPFRSRFQINRNSEELQGGQSLGDGPNYLRQAKSKNVSFNKRDLSE